MVADNFHHMDDDNPPTRLGEYDSYEEALAQARRVVDSFLADQHKPGMQPDELYRLFTTFGDDPIVLPRDPEQPFDSYAYAKARCAELCAT